MKALSMFTNTNRLGIIIFLAGNLHQMNGEFNVLRDIYCGILKQLNFYIVRNKSTFSFKEYTLT